VRRRRRRHVDTGHRRFTDAGRHAVRRPFRVRVTEPVHRGRCGARGSADVPVGGARIFAERGIVITQPEAGSFKAFSSLCTHQRCPVTEVNGDSILCKCHGSAFSITDGAPKTGPATQPLAEVPITVSGGEIRRA
jgi:Rieske Fe-S protein